jgi:hypothetical protein
VNDEAEIGDEADLLADVLYALYRFADEAAQEFDRAYPAEAKKRRRRLFVEIRKLRRNYFTWIDEAAGIERVSVVARQLEWIANAAGDLGDALRALSPQAKDSLLDSRQGRALWNVGGRHDPPDAKRQELIQRALPSELASHRDRMREWERQVVEGDPGDDVRMRFSIEPKFRTPADIENWNYFLRIRRLRSQTARRPPRPSPHVMTSAAAETAFALRELAEYAQRKLHAQRPPRKGGRPEMQTASPEDLVVRGLMRLIFMYLGPTSYKNVTVSKGSKFSNLLLAFEGYVGDDISNNDEPNRFKQAAKRAPFYREEVLAWFERMHERAAAASGLPPEGLAQRKKRGRPRKPPPA